MGGLTEENDAEEQGGDDGGAGAEEITPGEGHSGQEGMIFENEADEQDINREPGGATHEGGDEDGGEAIAVIGNEPGGHDGGEGAGVGGEEGDEGLAGEADAAHQAIHDEGGAGEITGVFQDADEEEQEHDLGKEDNGSGYTRDHAIGEKVADGACGERPPDESAEVGEEQVDAIHGEGGEGEDDIKHPGHDGDEEEDAEDGMGEGGVEAVGEGVALFANGVETADAFFHDGIGPGGGGVGVGGVGELGGADGGLVEVLDEFFDTFAGAGAYFEYGAAELLAQHGLIDRQAAALGEIDHVENDYDRESLLKGLIDEDEVAGEIGGVGDDDDGVGRRRGTDAPGEEIKAELGFGAIEVEAVDSRKINQGVIMVIMMESSDAGIDGTAGEVCGFGADAAEPVEEGGFAGVGIAEEGEAADGGGGIHPRVWGSGCPCLGVFCAIDEDFFGHIGGEAESGEGNLDDARLTLLTDLEFALFSEAHRGEEFTFLIVHEVAANGGLFAGLEDGEGDGLGGGHGVYG